MKFCNAAECLNEPIPGLKLCDYHQDMQEEGTPFLMKPKRGRPRLDKPVAEKAAKWAGMKDRAAALNRKRRGIRPPTPSELAAKLDLKRAKDRARKNGTYRSAKEQKADLRARVRQAVLEVQAERDKEAA